MLTKDQIKAANDRPREFLPIPEWCPSDQTFDPNTHGVWVGTMSGKDRDSYESELLRRKGPDEHANLVNLRATLAVRTVQDKDGNRLFTDADAEWLGDKAAGPLSAIFNIAVRLNRLRNEDVEELTKN